MIYHLTRDELSHVPVGSVIMARGKELRVGDTVADARVFFKAPEVLVLPILDGARYLGAVDRELLERGEADETPVMPLAADIVPVAAASTKTEDALARLDEHGGQRLVVVDEDGCTYVGIVCLRTDRRRLCVDGERLERLNHDEAYADDFDTTPA